MLPKKILSELEHDPELKEKVAYYMEKLEKIRITPQVTEGHIKQLNSLLDDLYEEVQFDYTIAKNNHEDIKTKLDVVIKTNREGPNEQARAANGYKRACAFPIEFDERGRPTEVIDLFEWESILRWRATIFEAILKIVEKKADRLLSDLAVLKIESKVI
mgnify:CR=1 FL=1